MVGPCIEVTKERIRDWSRWEACLPDGAPSKGPKKTNFTPASPSAANYPDYPEQAEELDGIISGWAYKYDKYKEGDGTLLYNCLRSIDAKISLQEACKRLKISKERMGILRDEAIDITHACLHPESDPELFK